MTTTRQLDSLDARVEHLIDLHTDGPRERRPTQVRMEPPEGMDPFTGTILDVMDLVGLVDESWEAWRTFWRAVYALPMDAVDLERYERHTGRSAVPAVPVREAWMPIGRRAGKSRMAALAALFAGVRRNYTTILAPGELAVVPVIAADRTQAMGTLRYLKGMTGMDAFRPYLHKTLKEAVELKTGSVIRVGAASYRAVRGATLAGVVCDEIAFWTSEDSAANPDHEILTALRPGMATMPDALLLGLSSPYAAKGELFRAHQRFFGTDSMHGIAWNADTLSMNPSVDAEVVRTAFADDPISAASEYGEGGRVSFRRDVESFINTEAIQAVTLAGRREIPPMSGVEYTAFVDPSGGSQDSFTLAIAHRENSHAVLDAVREVRPPFSPEAVVSDFADTLKSYRVTGVTGDRYAGEWPRERFQVHGISYTPSERTKSDLYRELLPLVNAGSVELLDVQRLNVQLAGLERRVARGGKDSIDHTPGGRDDVANAAAGALVLVSIRPEPTRQWGSSTWSM